VKGEKVLKKGYGKCYDEMPTFVHDFLSFIHT